MIRTSTYKHCETRTCTKRFCRRPSLAVVLLPAALMIFGAAGAVWASELVRWDFTEGTQGWTCNNRIDQFKSTDEGLFVRATSEDPWIEGPPVDMPNSEVSRVRIRMKSNGDNFGELFYGSSFSAGHSVRFTVRNDDKWHNYSLVVKERLGRGTRFRLDPCLGAGDVTVASIEVEPMGAIEAPAFERPQRPASPGGRAALLRSGALELEHFGGRWGSFVLRVNGVEMACGYGHERIGLMTGERAEWLEMAKASPKFTTMPVSREFWTEAVVEDSGGGRWEIVRRIGPGGKEGTLIAEVEIKVDKDRELIHAPWMTIFPGLGTFGVSKSQGLFAGLEYLGDEPSSSDADIARPRHIRRTPDPVKITFPLMAISHQGNYIGLIWEPSEAVAATFDSPDRLYDSGAHLMALSAPAVGELRFENERFAHTPLRLKAGEPLKATVLIIGGKGRTIVPAVEQYVDLRGLSEVPEFDGGFEGAVNLLAHGWLDSAANRDGLFRHAVWGDSFGPGPAADAAMFMDWLGDHAKDTQLAGRLEAGRSQAMSRLPQGQPFSSGVSHVRPPAAPLVFGRVDEFVRQRRSQAFAALQGFDAKGIKEYRPGGTDYARTHFANHANGLGGRQVVEILEGATLSGDKALIEKALELLDKQTLLYGDTVPRGAQTWEVPLHTPDILASAHMVRSYALGYIISGRREYLEQARYWAWTGVPFVYLYPPTAGRVGPYATIAVLGATNWQAPSWFGQPVQWCGLVYGSALHLLSECDADGPWERIAKGITAAGLQMTWPLTDKERQGLLPDYFLLRQQISDGPAINPGTVQAHLAELYGKGRVYDLKRAAGRGWFVHAPCTISDIRESTGELSFKTGGWGDRPYYVLVSGVQEEPSDVQVRGGINEAWDRPASRPRAKEYHDDIKCLIISLTGESQVQIR